MEVKTRRDAKKRRHLRLRNKIHGTAQRPRLCVNRTLKHCYAQIINDDEGRTLVSASTVDMTIKDDVASTGNMEAAAKVGALVAQRAKERGIERVVFDRTGNRYHGRMQSLAEAAREGGLDF